MTAVNVMWVGLGGGVGSLLRWWIGLVIGKIYKGNLPIGIFIINISGAFIIGYLSIIFSVDWLDRYGDLMHAAVLTGILGGYTTFSSMQLDAAKLSTTQGRAIAAGYLITSVLVGLAAAKFGVWLAY